MRKASEAAAVAAELTLVPVIGVVLAPDAEASDDDGGRTGLIALVGLAALAGLRRRDTRFYAGGDTGSGSSTVR